MDFFEDLVNVVDKGKGRAAPMSAVSSCSTASSHGYAAGAHASSTTSSSSNITALSSLFDGIAHGSDDSSTLQSIPQPLVMLPDDEEGEARLKCSQCNGMRPASDFPLSISTFEPLKVCHRHGWYWTPERRKGCLPTKRVSRQQVIRELLDDDQQGWLTSQVGEGDEGEQGMDEWINRIADRYDWQVQVLQTRKSRAKNMPAAPLHQYLLTGRTQSYLISITHHPKQGVSAVTLDVEKNEDEHDRSRRVTRTRRPAKRARTSDESRTGGAGSNAPSPALSTLSSLAPTPMTAGAPTPHALTHPSPVPTTTVPVRGAAAAAAPTPPSVPAAAVAAPVVSNATAEEKEALSLFQNVLEASINRVRRAPLLNQPLPHANPYERLTGRTIGSNPASALTPATDLDESSPPSWSTGAGTNEPLTLEELLASPYLIPPEDVTLPPLTTYHPRVPSASSSSSSMPSTSNGSTNTSRQQGGNSNNNNKPARPSMLGRQSAPTPTEEELKDEDDEDDYEEEDDEDDEDGDWLEGFIMDQLGYEEDDGDAEEDEEEWRP